MKDENIKIDEVYKLLEDSKKSFEITIKNGPFSEKDRELFALFMDVYNKEILCSIHILLQKNRKKFG